MGKRRHLTLVVGMVLALAMVMAIVATFAPAHTANISTGLEVKGFSEQRVPAFKQCGGENFAPKKCEPGCICHAQNEYFHLCQAVEGQSQCNVASATVEANKAKKKAAPFMQAAKQASEKQTATEKAFASAAKKYHLAKAAADK